MDTIKRNNTKDEVAAIIKHEIISGNIPAGVCITQNDVADQLGLSRMPIREAFNVLVQDGFLKKLPTRKIIVNKITPYTIEVYCQLLSSIESDFLRLLIVNNTDAWHVLFSRFVENGKRLSQADELLQWHLMLSELCGDDLLSKIHLNIMNSFFLYALQNLSIDLQSQNELLKQLYALTDDAQIDVNLIKPIVHHMNLAVLTPMIKRFSDES